MLFARNVPGMTEVLKRSTVGIAGCGGLGSNAAMLLTRAGIGHLVLVDFDTVEESNLNRQHFFQNDIGKPKASALAAHLSAINPAVKLAVHDMKLSRETVAATFAACDILIEAFDRADAKEWLIEAWTAAYPDRPIVAASGIAGYGDNGTMTVRRAGNVHLVGDGRSDMAQGLCAARVMIAAALEANTSIELLMKHKK
ncbi:MAG TPA: sulfur carrier protein ThiS adenylyltransferase ThiF [bacterium]|nr:sulfur carrier protein ThiS adenylyltransferase ThiF [bacterium]